MAATHVVVGWLRCGSCPGPANGLESCCPAEAGRVPLIVAPSGGPGASPYAPARRPKVPAFFPGGQPKTAERPANYAGRSARGVISQDLCELLGGQNTLPTSSRSNRANGCQALDLGDHVVDAWC